jgi:signal transduction histidine kinase
VFPQLAAALRAGVSAIVEGCVRRLRQDLPRAARLSDAQLRDHWPEMLHSVADSLDIFRDGSVLAREGSRRGINRLHHEYTIDELLAEGQLLRQRIVEQTEEGLGRPMYRAENLALQAAIDGALQASVAAYVAAHDVRLRESAEAEAKYFSYLSHDLKNNLNGLALVLESHKRHLLSRTDIADEFADDLAELGAALKSIARTTDGVERMLLAERLRSSAVLARMERIRLSDAISDVARQLAKEAARKGIGLAIEVPSDAEVNSDRDWVVVVLQNLLGNAVKYSTGGTVKLKAEPQVLPAGWRWLVSVTDQGPGIAAEHLHRIFETFQRGETHGQGGAGLGLAIAWLAARLLGAEISAESNLNVGSTFFLAFPAQPPASTLGSNSFVS